MDDLPGVVMTRSFQLWQRRRKDRMRDLDLGLMEVSVLGNALWLERRGERITQALLTQRIGSDKVTVSQSVRSLRRKGHLDHVPHPTDARSHELRLTDSGRDLAWDVVDRLTALNEEFFAPLADQASVFIELHTRLITAQQQEEFPS
jgi:DNA-binding MarR family transcriptional regulator